MPIGNGNSLKSVENMLQWWELGHWTTCVKSGKSADEGMLMDKIKAVRSVRSSSIPFLNSLNLGELPNHGQPIKILNTEACGLKGTQKISDTCHGICVDRQLVEVVRWIEIEVNLLI